MHLDLHIHSNASDGSLDPGAVVHAAVQANLDVIAIADHDTVGGVHAALEAARDRPIEVVPAIEMSATVEQVELHLLGYFVDHTNPELVAHTDAAARRRETRLRQMVDRLAEQGLEISFPAVCSISGRQGTLGRPHLARAMVEAGHVDSIQEAFVRYIGNAHPAYVPASLVDSHQAIGLIGRAGGIAVWAHPPLRLIQELLPALRVSGLRGLEVYRPRASLRHMRELERFAREGGLMVSGGSDWHGPEQGPLGDFRVEAAEVSDLISAGGM